MTEILTESFCERCGTRYTFESARPRMRLKGVRVMSRGLKNFVLSNDASMTEAMASARSDTDRELTSYQLDAFHKTFNFCMTCRQYTCPNCWNEAEARCLTCAPHLGHEIMPAPFPELAPTPFSVADPVALNGTNGSNVVPARGGSVDLGAGPSAGTDDAQPGADVDVAARLEALTAYAIVSDAVPEVEAVVAEAPVEVDAVVADEIVAEPVVVETASEAVVAEEVVADEVVADEVVEVVADEVVAEEAPIEAIVADEVVEAVGAEAPLEAEAEDQTAASVAPLAAAAFVVEAAEPEAPTPYRSIGDKTAAQTTGLLQRFRPGQNLDAELDAYERERAAAIAASDLAAQGIETPVTAVEPAAEPSAQTAQVVHDVIPQPTWRMIAPEPGVDAPDATPLDSPARRPAAADPNAEPQWPTRPSWLGAAPSAGLPFLGRPTAPQGGADALWAESTRDVVASPLGAPKAAGGVQLCVSCGLSLSATARFCRRCGAAQAG